MSVFDIMDYVNRTPHNTNPAVIRSMVENEIYKTEKESNEELKILKEKGGVGWEEWIVTETMPATVIPVSQNYGTYVYPFAWPGAITGDNAYTYMYINDSKYLVGYDEDGYIYKEWVDGLLYDVYIQLNSQDEDGNFFDCLTWYGGDNLAPETITLRFENVKCIIHHFSKKYLPQDFQNLPATVKNLGSGEITVIEKAQYVFDEWDENVVQGVLEMSEAALGFEGLEELLRPGVVCKILLNETEFVRPITFGNSGSGLIVGNPIFLDYEAVDNGDPFCLYVNSYGKLGMFIRGNETTYNVEAKLCAIGTKSTKIDLGAFQIPEHIMQLAAEGGGKTTIPGLGFWDTLEAFAGTDVHFKMSVAGYTFDVSGLTMAYNDDYSTVGIGQVSFNFLLNNPITNEIGIIYVSLMRNTPNIVLTVRIVQ